MRRYYLVILLLTLLLPGRSARAAEITDVLDAGDTEDPYDFNLELFWEHSEEWGLIQREYNCSNTRWNAAGEAYTLQADAAGYDPNCAAGDRIVSARELDYRRTTNILDFQTRFAIWKDLEFRFLLPYVLGDQTGLSLAGTGGDPKAKPVKAYCVRGQNCSPSSIYREDAAGVPDLTNSLFTLPHDSKQRTGVGDLQFGLLWSPWNAERDDTVATWLVGVNYVAPTASVMEAGNTAVGRGLHELTFQTKMSRRFTKMDPYVGFDFTLVLPSSKSLFEDYGQGQTLVGPGNRFGIEFGTEIVPWEKPQKHQKFSLDFGGRFGYQFEGRDFSPLFDALGTSSCNGSAEANWDGGCQLTRLNGRNDSEHLLSNGITDVEQYGQVWGWFGFNVQAAQFLKFRAQVNLSHQFDHFLTNADSGKDNGKQVSETINGQEVPKYRPGYIDPGTEEENPVFNPNVDLVGRRLRLAEHLDLSAFIMAALTF